MFRQLATADCIPAPLGTVYYRTIAGLSRRPPEAHRGECSELRLPCSYLASEAIVKEVPEGAAWPEPSTGLRPPAFIRYERY